MVARRGVATAVAAIRSLMRALRRWSCLRAPAKARRTTGLAGLLRLRFSATRRAAVELRRRATLRREPSEAWRATRIRGDTLNFRPEASFEPPFCARRARFQALRATAASLRARLASRLASFRRLRARFSSSFAMRTRCLATSACSRTRPSGSATEPCALPVFFMRRPCSERCAVSHKHALVSSRRSYPQKLCITMWTAALPDRKA
jgi:hypothetical protein